jgi:diguanylate cyclase (GGDEF)-like protein/PAS domain S-box-containing protein
MDEPRLRRLDDPETLRGFVRTVREGIYVTNPRGDFLDANPAFLEIFGYRTLAELKDRRVEEVLVDPGARARELDQLHREGSIREFEFEVRRVDGTTRTVIDTAYVHTDSATGEVFYHGILVDITERKRLQDQVLEQTLRDPLTGCYNRRYLAQLSRRLEELPASWGGIVFDVDGFKRYNDEFGHDAGDAILVKLARFLMRQTRALEAVVRMGGDEFLVVLPGADERATERVADRVRFPSDREGLVPFSLGWAAREEGESVEKTIFRADQNLLASRTEHRPTTALRVPASRQ